MTNIELITILIALFSLVISFISLFLSYRKDKKCVLFSIYRASISNYDHLFGLADSGEYEVTKVDIVNKGFRPICINNIGGDFKVPFFKRVKRFVTLGFVKDGYSMFIWPSKNIIEKLQNEDGSYKLIQPSEKISISIMDSRDEKVKKSNLDSEYRNIDSIKNWYAIDVDGTKYKATRYEVKKLKSELKRVLKESTIDDN